ncbi:MAG: M3 family peptidase, partial [Marinoscillum sp.]
MSNPFLTVYNTPFEVPPFHLIKNEHYMPALNQAIVEAREEIENIASSAAPTTFENTIEALEKSGALMERV